MNLSKAPDLGMMIMSYSLSLTNRGSLEYPGIPSIIMIGKFQDALRSRRFIS